MTFRAQTDDGGGRGSPPRDPKFRTIGVFAIQSKRSGQARGGKDYRKYEQKKTTGGGGSSRTLPLRLKKKKTVGKLIDGKEGGEEVDIFKTHHSYIVVLPFSYRKKYFRGDGRGPGRSMAKQKEVDTGSHNDPTGTGIGTHMHHGLYTQKGKKQ